MISEIIQSHQFLPGTDMIFECATACMNVELQLHNATAIVIDNPLFYGLVACS